MKEKCEKYDVAIDWDAVTGLCDSGVSPIGEVRWSFCCINNMFGFFQLLAHKQSPDLGQLMQNVQLLSSAQPVQAQT